MSVVPTAMRNAWLACTVLSAAVGVLCGVASATFLFALDVVTGVRVAHEALVYALPLAGLALGTFLERFGTSVAAGTSLVLDRIHTRNDDARSDVVPLRMVPIVLLGTLVTHLFGGSAGREGTAVQMGASLADSVALRADVDSDMRRHLLIAGVAGGFGSVFGTPWAGAIFGIEVAVFGQLQWRSLWPGLIAAVVGDGVTRALSIEHTRYPTVHALTWSPSLLWKWALFAAAVALTSIAFIEVSRRIKRLLTQRAARLAWRMTVGGAVVVVLWQAVATSDYLGLGMPTILRAFDDPALTDEAFVLKLVFTAVTIGAGFIGGEVTPLFFIGAALGNVLARVLGLPLDLAVGVGMAAMFAAASNAPLALSVMALELFGAHVFGHALPVCVLACLLSGHRGIYGAQRIARSKLGRRIEPSIALRDFDQRRDSKPMPSNGPE